MQIPDKLTASDFFEIFFSESLLPELGDVLETNEIIRLISTFGGVPFQLPTNEELQAAMRDLRIYVAIRNQVAAPALGRQYGISRQRVTQIYRSTVAKIEAYQALKKEGKTRLRLFHEDTALTKPSDELKNILDDHGE